VRSRLLAAALAVGAVLGWAAACGGPKPSRNPAELTARRNEITALWAQIRDWRREGGMDVEPDEGAVMAMKRMSVSTAARACALPASPRKACGDVCDLGDAICDNAESICGIADDLGNDPWARDKCDSAKASCREAQERCCRCDRNPPEEPSSP
jgi:hypothetical protein